MALHLSNRAQAVLQKQDFLDYYNMLCLHDPYNPLTNKKVKTGSLQKITEIIGIVKFNFHIRC